MFFLRICFEGLLASCISIIPCFCWCIEVKFSDFGKNILLVVVLYACLIDVFISVRFFGVLAYMFGGEVSLLPCMAFV